MDTSVILDYSKSIKGAAYKTPKITLCVLDSMIAFFDESHSTLHAFNIESPGKSKLIIPLRDGQVPHKLICPSNSGKFFHVVAYNKSDKENGDKKGFVYNYWNFDGTNALKKVHSGIKLENYESARIQSIKIGITRAHLFISHGASHPSIKKLKLEGHTIKIIPKLFLNPKETEKNVTIACTLSNHKGSFKGTYNLQIVDYHPIIHSVNSEVSLPETYPS